jgi:hypothetical protein
MVDKNESNKMRNKIIPADLWSTQPLTEMSTRDLLEDKGRPAREADNLTAISVPIIYKM